MDNLSDAVRAKIAADVIDGLTKADRDKLLKDLDEHIELLKDVFSGKTGIRLPDSYKKVQL